MAATNVMTAPLLPEAPITNEIPGETYHYIPQDPLPKAPEAVSVEVPQEMPQEDIHGSSQEASEATVPEGVEDTVLEKAQDLSEESTREVAEELPEELTQEMLQEVAQEATQELPIEPTAEVEVTQQPSVNKSKPIIPVKSDLAPCDRVSFEPAKHIKFTPPSKVWTMQELDYPEGKGISPVGVSEPFPLFSEEAVKQMRAEILDEKVWDKYKFSSNLSQCQLRGFAPEYVISPFANFSVLTIIKVRTVHL
jgi:hypothetical protein